MEEFTPLTLYQAAQQLFAFMYEGFSGVWHVLNMPIADLSVELTTILPEWGGIQDITAWITQLVSNTVFGELSLFSLMFGGSITLFVCVILVAWILKAVPIF